jgi:hypothetical protein
MASRDRPEYAAEPVDERACDTTVTDCGVRDSSAAALASYACDLHSQLAPLVAKADKLRNLCDRRGREPSPSEKRRMRALSAELARALALVADSAARLIAPPAPGD